VISPPRSFGAALRFQRGDPEQEPPMNRNRLLPFSAAIALALSGACHSTMSAEPELAAAPATEDSADYNAPAPDFAPTADPADKAADESFAAPKQEPQKAPARHAGKKDFAALGGAASGASSRDYDGRALSEAKPRLSSKIAPSKPMASNKPMESSKRQVRSRRAPAGAALVYSQPMTPPPPPAEPEPTRAEGGEHGGTFVHAGTNPLVKTSEDAQSTFSIDVDTASYNYARRFLERGQRPNASSVRVEEWVNAFHYDYEGPGSGVPFSVHLDGAPSPFSKQRHLVRVGIQGKEVAKRNRKPVHLTFLVDVSGSMSRTDKLPLAQRSLHLLTDQLTERDSVSLVTYAGRTGEVLPQTRASTSGKRAIHRAIDNLRSGGGTNMGSGMEIAYRNAGKYVSDESVSRVIVLSDGDANIGRTSHQAILNNIKGYVSEGVKMSTIGFGTGNYRDHLMEQLADAGDGNYTYIDSFKAAKKAFVTDLTGTLQVIAKDVKIQVEFDPAFVAAYRLVGYENRDIADRDFDNDKVDAGEIGAGHTVTALYEVVLTEEGRYAAARDALAKVRVRYKAPRGMKSTKIERTLKMAAMKDRFGDLDDNVRFASAVAIAAEVLRGSEHASHLSLDDAWALASEALEGPYKKERQEFVALLERAREHGRDHVAWR
jgi:Ca-activated chloride channel family protein